MGKTNFILIIYLTEFLNLLQLYGHYCDLKVLRTGVNLTLHNVHKFGPNALVIKEAKLKRKIKQ